MPLELLRLDAVVPPFAVAGVVVVTLGVYVANYRGGDPVELLRRAATSRPARLALLSAGAYAVGDVSKRAAEHFTSVAFAVLPRASSRRS